MSNPSFSGAGSFELVSQGRSFPLAYGMSLSRNEFPMLTPSTPGGPVAQVSANPNDPTQLGLQNLTAQPWIAYMPDGSQQQIDPGRSARLMDGVTVQMGAVQGQIRAAQAPGQAAFTPPGLGQQAPQFGQQQAPGFGQPPPPQFGQQQAPGFGQQQAPAFGQPQVGGAWPPPPGGVGQGGWNVNMGANDSGTGATAVLPPQLQGFNVGACFANWIWAIGNKSYIGLLALIPCVGIVMWVVLGIKGNEWAWQNRRWDSIEQFQATQKVWAIWGWVFLALDIISFLGRLASIGQQLHQ